jgi:hypothetical protein
MAKMTVGELRNQLDAVATALESPFEVQVWPAVTQLAKEYEVGRCVSKPEMAAKVLRKIVDRIPGERG